MVQLFQYPEDFVHRQCNCLLYLNIVDQIKDMFYIVKPSNCVDVAETNGFIENDFEFVDYSPIGKIVLLEGRTKGVSSIWIGKCKGRTLNSAEKLFVTVPSETKNGEEEFVNIGSVLFGYMDRGVAIHKLEQFTREQNIDKLKRGMTVYVKNLEDCYCGIEDFSDEDTSWEFL